MSASRSVAVTGGLGNLGTKLLLHLARTSPCNRLIGLDVRAPSPEQLRALQDAAAQNTTGSAPAIELLECDLTDPHDRRWRDALDRVQAVVHFAAFNPYPDAGWDDAAISIDMTLNVALAAADSHAVERFVFATSNHVMGRYGRPRYADPRQTPGRGHRLGGDRPAPGRHRLLDIENGGRTHLPGAGRAV